MQCKFHVGVTLVGRQERIPFDSDLSDFTRTVLRCPIPQCSVVAMVYDENKTDTRYCDICGSQIKADDTITLSGSRCSSCKASGKYFYRRGHQPKRGRWKHHTTARERTKRGARMRAAKRHA
jgi:hypothetical protein